MRPISEIHPDKCAKFRRPLSKSSAHSLSRSRDFFMFQMLEFYISYISRKFCESRVTVETAEFGTSEGSLS